MRLQRKILLFLMFAGIFASCSPRAEKNFTAEETDLIGSVSDNSLMRVLQTDSYEDSLFLRRYARPISERMMKSQTYNTLCNRMLTTVMNPENEGVGIAAPQVGVSRKLIAVQRFDKPGEPFEFYTNPEIVYYSNETALGEEGCLSVPARKGKVVRSHQIQIRYLALSGCDTTETVSGFTAVIFQHEIDHLNGIIYTDRTDTLEAL